jgi:hypothetical protein
VALSASSTSWWRPTGGRPLKPLDQTFVEMIKESENKALPLAI